MPRPPAKLKFYLHYKAFQKITILLDYYFLKNLNEQNYHHCHHHHSNRHKGSLPSVKHMKAYAKLHSEQSPLEKLKVSQRFKKFAVVYVTRWLITVFKRPALKPIPI